MTEQETQGTEPAADAEPIRDGTTVEGEAPLGRDNAADDAEASDAADTEAPDVDTPGEGEAPQA